MKTDFSHFVPALTQRFDAQLPDFNQILDRHGCAPLTRAPLGELQINLGRLCNQACEHCHVDAGPKRTEVMTRDTMQRILAWSRDHGIKAVDITGGAPEMNPGFRYFVDGFLQQGASVKSRCNLTVLLEPGQEDLARWYADRGIHLICSMPCYSEQNVDQQRGKGTFEKSIQALQMLNELGYGSANGPMLDLVYNPGGAFLPPDQQQLERDYKIRLYDDFGVRFNSLYVLANLPINRFARYLHNNNQLQSYIELLENAFNPATLSSLMCRHLISVDWRGYVFDCDFNQMLNLGLGDSAGPPLLWELDADSLEGRTVRVDGHCLGCTAGAGSSCGGSLV
ncbi:MAG: arsenosugar biosynthesis radical SAM protein ArsS [Thiohalobacterales bacterium]|nr:arsenosugar biosynthesis radical SAM protein ArsS [Thiohalobacterales bacterium]